MRDIGRGLLLDVVAIGAGVIVLAQGADETAGDEGVDATLASQYLTEITAAPYTAWAFQPNVPAGASVDREVRRETGR